MSERYRIVLPSKHKTGDAQYWTRDYGFHHESNALTFSKPCARFVLDNLKNPFPSLYEDPRIEAVPVRCVCPNWLAAVVVALLVAILLAVVLK